MSTPFSVPRQLAKRLGNFALLWSGCLAVIFAIAGLEALLLWQHGYTYSSKNAVLRRWVADMSLSDSGQMGAALTTSMQNGNGSWNDILLVDLSRRVAAGLELRELHPSCVALSPKADSLAIAAMDGSVYAVSGAPELFSGARKAEPKRVAWTGHDEVMRLVFSPDASHVAAIGAKFTWVWSWPDGQLLRKTTHKAVARGFLAFSPDSQRVIAPRPSGLCMMNIASREPDVELQFDELPVVRALPDFDSQRVAVASYDEVCVYDFDGRRLWQAMIPFPMLALDARQRLVALAANKAETNIIEIRDFATGRLRMQIDGKDSFVAGLAFTADGDLATWDFQGHVKKWDVSDGKLLWSMEVPGEQEESPLHRGTRRSASPEIQSGKNAGSENEYQANRRPFETLGGDAGDRT